MSAHKEKHTKFMVSARPFSLFLTLSFLASQFCNASPNARALAEYFDIPQRVKQETQQISSQMAASHPHIADVLLRSLKYTQHDEMIGRAEVIFDSGTSQKDMKTFVAFISTPLGQRVGEVLRTKINPKDIQENFSGYSLEEQTEINIFFASPAAKNVISSLSSPAWSQTWKLYGELLMCRYIENEEPERFESLRNLGKCLLKK